MTATAVVPVNMQPLIAIVPLLPRVMVLLIWPFMTTLEMLGPEQPAGVTCTCSPGDGVDPCCGKNPLPPYPAPVAVNVTVPGELACRLPTTELSVHCPA